MKSNPLNQVKSAEPAPKTDEENEELKREWLKPFYVFVMDNDDDDEKCEMVTMFIHHNSSDDSDFCDLTHGDDSD